MRLVNARRILWKTKVQFQKVCQGQVRCKNRTFHAFLAGEQMANTKSSPKQMRPGPATRAASFVDLRSLPFRHLGQRNDGTGSAALARAPHLPLRQTAIQNRRSLTPAVASSPTPAQRAGGEEAAMPGQPVRTHARSVSPGNSPSRITGLPLASPQSSFGEPHEVQRFR